MNQEPSGDQLRYFPFHDMSNYQNHLIDGGRLHEAQSALQTWIEAHPNSHERQISQIELARAQFWGGDSLNGKNTVDKILHAPIGDNWPMAVENWALSVGGKIETRLGHFDKAKQLFERAKNINGQNHEASTFLDGESSEQAKQIQELISKGELAPREKIRLAELCDAVEFKSVIYSQKEPQIEDVIRKGRITAGIDIAQIRKEPYDRTRRRLIVGIAASLGSVVLEEAVRRSGLGSLLGLQQRRPVANTDTSSSPEQTQEATNSLEALLQPFVAEALKRRVEREKNDPEYARRVDTELNNDRVNFLVYGYGDTLENPPENPNLERGEMGSHSVFSYNRKTGQFDIISLTHDIRAPEIENYLRSHGREATPTKIHGAYGIGGFPLQREVIEDATGLAVDFQIVMPDTFIKDLTEKVFGTVAVDVPFGIDVYPFYHEGKLYPEGYFEKGPQEMDGIRAMQFLKAWSKTHMPEHERNIRKHLFMQALLRQARKNKTNISFLLNSVSFFRNQQADHAVEVDFDPGALLLSPSALVGIAKNVIGQGDDRDMFRTNKTMYVVDPYAGGPEGGVVWATRNESPIIKDEIRKGVIKDPTMVVPQTKNANPYSANLIIDYWQSVRILIKDTLVLKPNESMEKTLPSVHLVDAKPLAFERPAIWCDSNNPVHWDGDIVYVFNSSKGGIYRSSGPDLFHLKLDPKPVRLNNEALQSDTWIEATYKHPNGLLYGWYHREDYSDLDEQNKTRKQKVSHPQVGATVSRDNGVTWHDLGVIIDAPRGSFRLDHTENLFFAGGIGDFSAIPDEKGEYLNFFFTNYHKDNHYQGVSMARLAIKDLAAPAGKVEMWYEGKWQKIALDGKSTPIFRAEGDLHTGNTKFFWGPAVHYDTKNHMYVMVLNRSPNAAYAQEGVYVSYNIDIANPNGWSQPVRIQEYHPPTPDSWYPQVIGTTKGETDKRLGESGRFFARGESKHLVTFSS